MMSDERYRGKLLDLAVRVINAYVEVAYSKDQIALAEAQKAAYKEQLTLNDRLMSAGEGTITDVSETQARYSLAEAQVIEARDALDAAQRELEVIIGMPLNQMKGILALNQDVPASKMAGIPITDSASNELVYWLRSVTNVYAGGRQRDLEDILLIKGDNMAKYPQFKNVKYALKQNDLLKFKVVTNSETVPPGSELYNANREGKK